MNSKGEITLKQFHFSSKRLLKIQMMRRFIIGLVIIPIISAMIPDLSLDMMKSGLMKY